MRRVALSPGHVNTVQLNSSSFVSDLCQLNQLLDQQQFSAYLFQGLGLIQRAVDAAAVRIYLIDGRGELTDRAFQVGTVDGDLRVRVEQWESSLEKGAGLLDIGDRLERIEDSAVGAEDQRAHLLHIRVISSGVLYGGLSVTFAPGVRPAAEQRAALVDLADLVAGSFLRAQSLSVARRRLEDVSLLYQINQAVSSLDLGQVLREATELVTFVLNAQAATLYLADEANSKLVFMVTASGEGGDLRDGTQVALGDGIASWVAISGEPLIVNDVSQEPRFHPGVDGHAGFDTYNVLCVPMIIRNRPIGALQVLNKDTGFSEQDLSWLQAVSGQLAIALENARLYSREHEKVRELATLSALSQAITGELDIKDVVSAVTDSVLELLSADRSELLLIDANRLYLDLYAHAGTMLNQDWSSRRVPLGQGVVGWCAQTNQALVVPRLRDDPRHQEEISRPQLRDSSLVIAPLSSRGQTIGVIVVFSLSGRIFDAEHLDLLQTFANQAAIALENARLYQNLKAEQERIINVQEEIRHQLARDLHDGPAQMLYSILNSLELARRYLKREQSKSTLDELDNLETIARQASREVRTLLFELRPIMLESRGLVQALQAYHRQLATTLPCQIELDLEPLTFALLPKAANTLFIIIQESINNIRKHAHAEHVWIRLHLREETLYFAVEDDGVGMDVKALRQSYAQRNSYGMLNMRERAELLGGSLEVISPRPTYQSGTVIAGRVPLANIIDVSGRELEVALF